jgi:chemotaxis protein CheX
MAVKAKLKAEFVNPFLISAHGLVTTMLQGTLTRGEPGLSDGDKQPGHIMSVIGFTGRLKGSVAISMPNETAMNMIGKLLGMNVDDDETIIDGLAELVNMLAGAAKTELSEAVGETLNLSLPVVIRGDDYVVETPSKVTWLDVPFASSLGDFLVRISFEQI